MKPAIKAYVDNLFKGAPDKTAVAELREEIQSNLEARYDDCINAGMSPQRAYSAVIGTMGDVSGLIAQVSGTGICEEGIFEKTSPVSRLKNKYAYVFKDSNIKAIKNAAIAVMWLAIVCFYFIVSFQSYNWSFSWIIFLVGAALNVIIDTMGKVIRLSRIDDTESRIKLLKKIRNCITSVMWLAIVAVYFLFSAMSGRWELSWLIFIAGSAVQVVINTIFKVMISRFTD